MYIYYTHTHTHAHTHTYIYIGQILLKAKHKVKLIVKPPTSTHIPSTVQLSTWGKIRQHTVFILFVMC